MDPVMTAEGVALLLKCSVRTVEDKARAGALPGVKFGESWVFPTQALLEAVNALAAGGAYARKCAHQRATAVSTSHTPPSLPQIGGAL